MVADKSRTDKTICLAVSPSLKAYGISGRSRLFEVVQRVSEVNAQRKRSAPGRQLAGSSWHDPDVRDDPKLALDYLVAHPRMAHYIEWSTKIYNVYLKYVVPEDLYAYSIDEVLMDVTNYLSTYKLTPRELARKMLLDVLETTGITATAGIGANLYLAKVAMDIWAKHTKPDKGGVRIAEMDEMSYRKLLWEHRPLTDFWRVGRGYVKKLEAQGLYTRGDIARCSIGKPTDYYNEELLYKMFGVNTEGDLRPDDETHLIAGVIEVLGVLVMGQPDGVSAQFLDDPSILEVVFSGEGAALVELVLVTAHTPERRLHTAEDKALLGVTGEVPHTRLDRHLVIRLVPALEGGSESVKVGGVDAPAACIGNRNSHLGVVCGPDGGGHLVPFGIPDGVRNGEVLVWISHPALQLEFRAAAPVAVPRRHP